MQSRNAAKSRLKDASKNGSQQSSDSEDWTLVTPPPTQSKSAHPEKHESKVLGELIPLGNKQVEVAQAAKENIENEEIPLTSQPLPQLPPPPSAPKVQDHKARAAIESTSRAKVESEPTVETKQPVPRNEREFNYLLAILIFVFGWALCYIMSHGSNYSKAGALLAKILRSEERRFNFVYLDPADHVYTELKLLEEELLECIRSENPNFEDISKWLERDLPNQRHPADYYATPESKPIMGMVCYGKEGQWRKRFERLKTEHNFDMAKTLKRVRSQLTYEILEIHNPALRFRFIINQMDYLNTLEQRRKDRRIEKLEAEIQELKRKQVPTSRESKHGDNYDTRQQVASNNQKADTGPTENALISLQGQNRRLSIENAMLKQSLGEKAGTVYVKQSIELEKCERQNNVLRQFQQQVAGTVSKGLSQIDVQINDFGAILNDLDESLGARLNLTLNSLQHLVDETTQLAARNKSFQAELDEARLLNVMVVREAQNLIEGQSEANPSDYELMRVEAASDDSDTLTQMGPAESEADTLREFDSFKCVANSECLVTKVNWLMKRAKLREKLRKAQLRENEATTSSPHCQARNTDRRWRRRSHNRNSRYA